MLARTWPHAVASLALVATASWLSIGTPRSASAAGPLLLHDPATRTPYVFDTFPVPVYTDQGPLGILGNATADSLAAAGFAQWGAVPSSGFEAAVVSDLGAIGLGDIDGASVGLVIGVFNGGGIHVLYDDDGSILLTEFGAPPGVLGISSPEYAVGNILEESWVVLAGPEIAPGDSTGASFSGVFVHEFGHSINLAHSQTNGAMIFFGDDTGPGPCPTPYVGFPVFGQIETMYPFIDVLENGTGPFVATVDHLDDVASLSNLYPAAGGPASAGTITGTLYAIDGVTPLTGINVLARDVLDPFTNCVSAITGDYTQGALGPDGSFSIQGLLPGRDYVLYVDRLVAGGFSTPPGILSADEEYWDLAEAGDRVSDPPCNFSTILVDAGDVTVADIYANAVPPPTADLTPAALQFLVPEATQEYATLTLSNVAPPGADDLVWTVGDRTIFAKGRTPSLQAPVFSMVKARAHVEPRAPEELVSSRLPHSGSAEPASRRVSFVSKLGSVLDGGFELGGVWTEYSLNFLTPVCTLSLCGSGSGTGPRSGTHWAWFGGLSGGFEEASVSQTVTVPAGGAMLTFHLEQSQCDTAADYLEVLVDGVQVFVTDGAAAECGQLGYAPRSVDLAAFADGGLHTLEFRAETSSVSGGVTNFFVDDIDIVGSDCPWLDVYPQSGILPPGFSEPIEVAVNTIGVPAGSYQCEILVESNAAPDSVVIVPVDLDVVGSVLMNVRTEAEQRVSVFTTPAGTGDAFSQAQQWGGDPGTAPARTDATITVTLEDLSGAPIEGFPGEAIQLVSSLGGFQTCPSDTSADQDTDAAGQTVFQLPRSAGGGTDPLQDEVLQVTLDGVFVADAVYGDQVLYASDRAGNLFQIDTVTGAGTFVCMLPSQATDIEYDKTTGQAWVQEPNTGFTAHRFSIRDCAQIGAPVFNGTAFNALEYIDDELFGVASPSTCANSSLRILDPATGTAIVLGPTGIGPVSGLAWDRSTGTLYGVTGCSQDVPTELITLNLFTGAASSVGLTGVSLGSLQFGPDGVLYAGGDERDGGNLYSIDPATGQATLVGPTGYSNVTGLTLVSPHGLDIQFNGPDLVPDGVVNLSDLGAFSLAYSSPTYDYRLDYRWDGVINLSDVGLFALSFGEACAPAAALAGLPESNTIGVYFEPDDALDVIQVEPDKWITAHVVLRGPAASQGVAAWSGRIQASSNVALAGWSVADGSLNLEAPPAFLVGCGRVTGGRDAQTLLSFRLRVLDASPAEVVVVPREGESSVQVALVGSGPTDSQTYTIAAHAGRINVQGGEDSIVPFAGYRFAASPNPFNPATTLSFDLPRAARVQIDVYDLRGRRVQRLGPLSLEAGPQRLQWQGRDDRGRQVHSGVYLCQLRVDGTSVGEPIKINLVK